MSFSLEELDRAATLAINGFSGAFTDAVMPILSNRAVWVPFYLLLFFYLWRRLGWKKALVILATTVLSVAVIDQVANLVKYSAMRLRPCWDELMTENGLNVLESKGSKYGFFSAHAATCAGVATVVTFLMRRLDEDRREILLLVLLILWVAGVSISRVYVGKHFLGDILVGALAGIILARLLSWLVHWVITKFFSKFVD